MLLQGRVPRSPQLAVQQRHPPLHVQQGFLAQAAFLVLGSHPVCCFLTNLWEHYWSTVSVVPLPPPALWTWPPAPRPAPAAWPALWRRAALPSQAGAAWHALALQGGRRAAAVTARAAEVSSCSAITRPWRTLLQAGHGGEQLLLPLPGGRQLGFILPHMAFQCQLEVVSHSMCVRSRGTQSFAKQHVSRPDQKADNA